MMMMLMMMMMMMLLMLMVMMTMMMTTATTMMMMMNLSDTDHVGTRTTSVSLVCSHPCAFVKCSERCSSHSSTV